MTGGFTLVAPTVADADALSAMAQDSFRTTFAHMNYPAADLAAFLDSAMGPARYAAQIADPAYALRLARDADGNIAGFIKMGPNELPVPVGDPPPEQARELHQLYLLPAAQGTGVAADLMAWGFDWARGQGARALYLSVWVDNHRARRFYERFGFEEVGANPFHVGAVVDDDRVLRAWL